MSETRVKWHKYPEEPIPKRFKKVLVTEKDPYYIVVYISYVGYLSSNVIAWAELPDHACKRKTTSENKCIWNSQNNNNYYPKEDGYKLVTIKYYKNNRWENDIERLCSFEGIFVNTNKFIVAWAELPEPYKEEEQ